MLFNKGKVLFFQETVIAINDMEQHLLAVCRRSKWDGFQEPVFSCTIYLLGCFDLGCLLGLLLHVGSWCGWGKLAGWRAAWPGTAAACLGGTGALWCDLLPWVPTAQLVGEHRAPFWPLHPCLLPRETGPGQGRWVLLIPLWRWGVKRSACSGPMFYMELLKFTDHCVASRWALLPQAAKAGGITQPQPLLPGSLPSAVLAPARS